MRNHLLLIFVLFTLCVLVVPLQSRPLAQGAGARLSQQDVQATLKQYCITCHNQRAKTANLELDSKDLAHLEQDVAAWEAVVRKLRTGMMPPKNASRPDRATLDGVA